MNLLKKISGKSSFESRLKKYPVKNLTKDIKDFYNKKITLIRKFLNFKNFKNVKHVLRSK
jgi:hypothetical protein